MCAVVFECVFRMGAGGVWAWKKQVVDRCCSKRCEHAFVLVLAGVWGSLGPFSRLCRIAVGLGGLSCVCGCVRMRVPYGCWRCVVVGEATC